MNESQAREPDERVMYLATYLRAAWGGVNMMFTHPPCVIESFGADGTDTVYVTTVGTYQGQQWRYRRQAWPAVHPPILAAQLYTTALEERLNTRELSPEGDTGTVDL